MMHTEKSYSGVEKEKCPFKRQNLPCLNSKLHLTLTALRVLLIFIAKLLVNVLIVLAITSINLGNFHTTSSHPQKVVSLELVNLVKEPVESAHTSQFFYYSETQMSQECQLTNSPCPRRRICAGKSPCS